MSGSALNLFQLARLLPERGLSMVLCHGKRDAYPVDFALEIERGLRYSGF
jgi:hypothetical protein